MNFDRDVIINTSLYYQVLLYLNSFYFGMFSICELGIQLIKFNIYPYPSTGTKILELFLFLFLCCVESARIYLGRKGNLSERAIPFVLSILLMIPSTLGVIYILAWQMYILRLDVILCSLQLLLIASEFIFAIMCFFQNMKSSIY